MAAHEGAIGEPLPTPVVRAAMAVRLNGIARGGAGASLPVAQALAALLNAGVTPVVARTGSVGASDLMHMAAIAQVLIGTGHAEVGGEILPGAEALGEGRPRARRPRTEGRPGAHLGQRRVDRAGGDRGRACGPPRARRRPRARRVDRGRVRQPVGPRPCRAGRQARARPARRGRRGPGVPRRQRAVHAGRSRIGAGSPVVPRGPAGPRRVPRVHRDPRGGGRDRAQRHGRQPAGRRRVRADAQQRQLPPHGARAQPRRAAAGHRARRAAVRPAHEPPVVVDRRAVHGRIRRRPDRAGRGPPPLHGRDAIQRAAARSRGRRRSTSARSTSASRITRPTPC